MARMKHITLFLFSFLFIAVAHAAPSKKTDERIVTGWVEKVHIDTIDATFMAKLDTGAMTSSIDADIIELPEKDEPQQAEGDNAKKVMAVTSADEAQELVIFSIKDDKDEARTLERPVNRWVRIKTKEGGFIRRPVITMTFCIAGRAIEEEVNLADRDHFNYPVLIGRNMLKKAKLLIDSGRTYTADPSCPSQEVAERL